MMLLMNSQILGVLWLKIICHLRKAVAAMITWWNNLVYFFVTPQRQMAWWRHDPCLQWLTGNGNETVPGGSYDLKSHSAWKHDLVYGSVCPTSTFSCHHLVRGLVRQQAIIWTNVDQDLVSHDIMVQVSKDSIFPAETTMYWSKLKAGIENIYMWLKTCVRSRYVGYG